jgi:hypothetical protein
MVPTFWSLAWVLFAVGSGVLGFLAWGLFKAWLERRSQWMPWDTVPAIPATAAETAETGQRQRTQRANLCIAMGAGLAIVGSLLVLAGQWRPGSLAMALGGIATGAATGWRSVGWRIDQRRLRGRLAGPGVDAAIRASGRGATFPPTPWWPFLLLACSPPLGVAGISVLALAEGVGQPWMMPAGPVGIVASLAIAWTGLRARASHLDARWRLWEREAGCVYLPRQPPWHPDLGPKDEPFPILAVARQVSGELEGMPFLACQAVPDGFFGNDTLLAAVAMPVRSPGLSVQAKPRPKWRPWRRRLALEHATFETLFDVRARDLAFGSAVLHPRAMDLLLQAGPAVAWRWEGDWLWVGTPDPVRPEDALMLLPLALAFRALVPRHLLAPPPAQPLPAA